MRFYLPRLFAALLTGMVLTSCPPVLAQPPALDVIVSDPTQQLVDPEFDFTSNRFVWSDKNGRIWIGYVNRDTGFFEPPSGKAVQIATGALKVPLEVTNGPEWIYTSSGAQVVFSTTTATADRALGRAFRNGGRWSSEVLAEDRYFPVGSINPNDPQPKVAYLKILSSGETIASWRYLNNPASETDLPGSGINELRWVQGTELAVYAADVGNERQAFLYDSANRTLEQLTFDAGSKNNVFMWKAPEYGNELVFIARIDDEQVGVYRKLDSDGDGDLEWTRINTLKPPSVGRFIQSPEYFVYNGNSYVFMTTSDSPGRTNGPSDIWVAGIRPDPQLYRQCSDTTARVRRDPEVYITNQGPFIYYLASEAEGQPTVVWRCNPEL